MYSTYTDHEFQQFQGFQRLQYIIDVTFLEIHRNAWCKFVFKSVD